MFVLSYSNIFGDFFYIAFKILSSQYDLTIPQDRSVFIPRLRFFLYFYLMLFYTILQRHTMSFLKLFYSAVTGYKYQITIQSNYHHFGYYPIIKMFHSYKQPRFVHHSQKTFLPNDTSYVTAINNHIHDRYFLNKQKPNIYHFPFLPSLSHLNVIGVRGHKFKSILRFSQLFNNK